MKNNSILHLRRTSNYNTERNENFKQIPYSNKSGATASFGVEVLRKSSAAPAFLHFKTCDKMPISKEEQRIYDVIRQNYKGLIEQSFRPNFMRNKLTGQNFEIDIFLHRFKIGFEYQGAIHFERIEKYKNDPDKSRLHDTLKGAIFSNKYTQTTIVELFEDDLTGNILNNIIQRCKNTQLMLFRKGHYKKCHTLECLIQIWENRKDKPPKTWFRMLDRCYQQRCRKQSYINLVNFYLQKHDVLPGNEMFNIYNTFMVERFNQVKHDLLKNKTDKNLN